MPLTKEQEQFLETTAKYVVDISDMEVLEEGFWSDLFKWYTKKSSAPVLMDLTTKGTNDDPNIVFIRQQLANDPYSYRYVLLEFGQLLTTVGNEYNSLLKEEAKTAGSPPPEPYNANIISTKIKEILQKKDNWYPVRKSYLATGKLTPRNVTVLALPEAKILNAIAQVVTSKELYNIITHLSSSLYSVFKVSFVELKEVLPGYEAPAMTAPETSTTPEVSTTAPSPSTEAIPKAAEVAHPESSIIQAFDNSTNLDTLEAKLASFGLSGSPFKFSEAGWVPTDKSNAEILFFSSSIIPIPGMPISGSLFNIPGVKSIKIRPGSIKSLPVAHWNGSLAILDKPGELKISLRNPEKITAPAITPTVDVTPLKKPMGIRKLTSQPLITRAGGTAPITPDVAGVDYSKLMLDSLTENKKQENARFFKDN